MAIYDRQMTFDAVLSTILRHRRPVVGVPLVLACLVGVVTLVLPRTWTSTASFTPQSNSPSLGRLAGLAAQLGVSVPGQDPAQQPAFYAELLQSRSLLRVVVDSPLALAGATGQVLLRDLLGGSSANPAVRTERAVEALLKQLRVESTLKTGVVTLSVKTRRAELSQAIAARLLGEVDHFNRQTRQSQARQERVFLEARLAEARDSLRGAEDVLQAFLSKNREFSGSPQLTFERNRLERRVTEQQGVVSTLAQAYEQSRLDEVRDTPVITVLEVPLRPALPDHRLLILKVLLTLIGGFGLMTLVVLWREYAFRALLSLPDEGRELRGLWHLTQGDLLRPWRLLRRSAHD